MSAPVFKIKCTTCGKVSEATTDQVIEAREMGCFFSSCCQAVATVHNVSISQPKGKKAK